MTIKHEPVAISLPMDIYDELRRKAKLYDEIVNVKNLTKCPIKEQIFNIALDIVCNSYEQDRNVVLSVTRKPKPTKVRKIVMYCLVELGLSQQEIADYLNRKNHTSVHHHKYEVEGYMDVNPEYKREVTHIFNKIKLAVNDLQQYL